MNCKELSNCVGEYVDRTLRAPLVYQVEEHLSSCPKCAALVRQLEGASLMVRSLHRMDAPEGFERRLAERIAVRAESGASTEETRWIPRHLRMIAELLRTPVRWGHYAVRPVFVGLLLCVILISSLLTIGPDRTPEQDVPDMDWSYIETCQGQHASFASSNPLGDESAVMLRERARDLGDDL